MFDENSSGWSAGDLKYNKIYLEKYALESITAKYFILTEVVSVDHRINIESILKLQNMHHLTLSKNILGKGREPVALSIFTL